MNSMFKEAGALEPFLPLLSNPVIYSCSVHSFTVIEGSQSKLPEAWREDIPSPVPAHSSL